MGCFIEGWSDGEWVGKKEWDKLNRNPAMLDSHTFSIHPASQPTGLDYEIVSKSSMEQCFSFRICRLGARCWMFLRILLGQDSISVTLSMHSDEIETPGSKLVIRSLTGTSLYQRIICMNIQRCQWHHCVIYSQVRWCGLGTTSQRAKCCWSTFAYFMPFDFLH